VDDTYSGLVAAAGFDEAVIRLDGTATANGAAVAADRWIGDVPASVAWIVVGESAVTQGWKLHISSRTDRVPECLMRVLPLLREIGVPFKLAASSTVARGLNAGEFGQEQVGKIITIYPEDDAQAASLGERIGQLLQGFPGPTIDNELCVLPGAPVYARYGGFSQQTIRSKLGPNIAVVRDRDGQQFADVRWAAMDKVLRIESPFPAAQRSLIGPLIADRFLVVGPISLLGQRRVSIGVDIVDARRVAIKTARRHAGSDDLGRNAVAAIEHEYRLLSHFHDVIDVPTPIALVEDDARTYLVMDYVDGVPLFGHPILDRPATKNHISTVADIACRLVDLVESVHTRGCFVGDLAPPNILRGSDGRLTLVDLEYAGVTAEKRPTGFGVPGYMNPSVLARETEAGPESDLYGLAATLYYILTGVDLSSHPHAERLLAEGDMLTPPWRQLVRNLLSIPAECDTLLLLRDAKGAIIDSITGTSALTVSPREIARTVDGARSARDVNPQNLLRGLSRALCSCADWETDGPGIWTSRHPTTLGDQHRDFHLGDAGVAIGLLRLGIASDDPETIATVVRVADRLWVRRPEADYPAGLFIGECGVGLLYISLYEVTGDPVWLERAVHVSRSIGQMSFDSPDLLHGTAGRGLYHCWVYALAGEAEDLALANSAAEHLRATCTWTDNGPFWAIPPSYGFDDRLYCGIAHGSAGVAFFLSQLTRVADCGPFRDLLGAIMGGLQGLAWRDDEGDAVDWPDTVGGDFRSGVWCHGAAGIAQTFLAVHEVLPSMVSLDDAFAAAESALQNSRRLDATQCHGLAGLIEVYLDLYALTNDGDQLMVARWLGERMQSCFIAETSKGPMVRSDAPAVLTPEFMIGSSGAASALARLHRPDLIRHFLAPVRSSAERRKPTPTNPDATVRARR
jgi:hypothetical protein